MSLSCIGVIQYWTVLVLVQRAWTQESRLHTSSSFSLPVVLKSFQTLQNKMLCIYLVKSGLILWGLLEQSAIELIMPINCILPHNCTKFCYNLFFCWVQPVWYMFLFVAFTLVMFYLFSYSANNVVFGRDFWSFITHRLPFNQPKVEKQNKNEWKIIRSQVNTYTELQHSINVVLFNIKLGMFWITIITVFGWINLIITEVYIIIITTLGMNHSYNYGSVYKTEHSSFKF